MNGLDMGRRHRRHLELVERPQGGEMGRGPPTPGRIGADHAYPNRRPAPRPRGLDRRHHQDRTREGLTRKAVLKRARSSSGVVLSWVRMDSSYLAR
jgi:hypothetical protein